MSRSLQKGGGEVGEVVTAEIAKSTALSLELGGGRGKVSQWWAGMSGYSVMCLHETWSVPQEHPRRLPGSQPSRHGNRRLPSLLVAATVRTGSIPMVGRQSCISTQILDG